MTADHGVIFCTATILMSVLSPCSSFRGDVDTVCYTNVSIQQPRSVSYTETYRVSNRSLWCWIDCWETRTRTAYRHEYFTVPAQKQTCCKGYEYRNGTCRIKCPSTCMNGYCEQPDICQCDYGWGGEHCHEPLVCSIALQSDYVNYFEAMGIDSSALNNVQNISEARSIDLQKLPACESRCLDQLKDTTAHITRSANGSLYFIPINSLCTELKPWKRYDYVIGSVTVVILLLAMAVCIVCVVRRKQRTGITKDHAVTESEYDDVGMQPIPEYDYVGVSTPIPEYLEIVPNYDL